MTAEPPVLASSDGRPELRIERVLAHPRDKVWRAITEPSQLSAWYPFQATEIDPRVGGLLRFDDTQGSALDAVITEFDPPRAFAFQLPDAGRIVPGGREGPNTIRLELRPDDAGCRLIFTQLFSDRPAAASYAAGWQTCLDALAVLLTGARPVPGAPDAALHESYVRLFGLDQGSAEGTPDGWRVRFERQCMLLPIPAVWAALSGVDGRSPVRPGQPAPSSATTPPFHAGAVTAADTERLLEFDWGTREHAGGRVRWELAGGPGGARVTLTVTGPPELTAERSMALITWRDHLATLLDSAGH